ncbi:MAG: aspartate-semialdehyde dehydrogenase [Saprospiraceae bacterium]|nr:aspartate-semialdehyde dehydrogenase [Saprospiraceae bacterium]
MKIAVVGATGLVGTEMFKVLEKANLPITELIPVASARSVGKEIIFKDKTYEIVDLETAITLKPNIAIFSAGGSVSKEWAPKFAEIGCTVVDNSSAWRMEADIPLVVPEINAKMLTKADKIIANPNCSTIQLVLSIAPLHQAYGIKRMVVSTYQSFTGTGVLAVEQYEAEKAGQQLKDEQMAYHFPIFANCIPHCDIFLDNDYTKEEMKIVNETRKILNDQNLAITSTAVRVPVFGGHSESVNLEFEKQFDIDELRKLLSDMDGIIVQDNPANNEYPMPLMAKDKDEVFVGRIRRDHSIESGLNMWIVADNLRKGAATNAVQIASYLIENKLY